MSESGFDEKAFVRAFKGEPECPKWADGQHAYEIYYEHPGLNDGDSKVMSKHGPGPAATKQCLCGHEVKRT